jgi:hypothetical protein
VIILTSDNVFNSIAAIVKAKRLPPGGPDGGERKSRPPAFRSLRDGEFTLGDGVAAEEIDGAAFLAVAVSHASAFSGTPVRGHWFQGGGEGFLRDFFGEAAVAGEAGSVADTATDHTSFGCVRASAAISLQPDRPVGRGLFFPAEYLLRRRRVQSLPARRPGGSRPRHRLRGSWGCA